MKKNKSKDVVFLCQYFYPEYITSARLPFDIANSLVYSGYQVGALCGYPKEYLYHYDCPRNEVVNGIKIKRIKYFHKNRSKAFGRILNELSFTFLSLLRVGHLKDYKCVVVISDPPILPIVAIAAKKLFKTKIVFISYDIFPEIAIATKSIKENGLFSKFMNRLNRSFKRNLDKVVALTDEMKDFILAKNLELNPGMIDVIPNWATDRLKKGTEQKYYDMMGYRRDQFVVSYFGNLGTCQDIETLLEAAKLLKDNDEIQFLIAGHGNKILSTLKFIDENDLGNVQLLHFLEGEDFKAALSVSSCCVVSLVEGLKGTCAPSKYYSYLSIGSAVISIGEPDSYLSKEVVEEKIGVSVNCGDAEKLVDELLYLAAHREETAQMGARARQLYLDKYDRRLSLKKYKNAINELIK